ncbi:MAG: response regulator [Campylobacterales bacterium]|nr:response regulator [Campylobacterales bacterium]
MKKILIVDDNENNRMLLRALLEDYAEDNQVALSLDEAANGNEACLAAQKIHYDLILMDIMMPQMDGIEATRQIRGFDAKVMIVAVSAVDDGERQRQIIQNGAEDYIPKPINADIFAARMSIYFSLIASRSSVHKKDHLTPENLFSSDIFSRKFLFYVHNDDELAEFWEYYLLESPERSEELSDATRTLYAVAAVAVNMGEKPSIAVEESLDELYLTLVGLENINPKIITLIMLKNPIVTDYKMDADKLCIRVQRPLTQVPATPALKAEPVQAAVYTPAEETIQVYDYMDPEDLLDLKEYVGKLNSLMMIVGSAIDGTEVEEIAANLQQISSVSAGYTQSYPISVALGRLGSVIAAQVERFIEKSNDLAPMCSAFGRDLGRWIELIFVKGASSVHYMDDTILVNAQTIEDILSMDDEQAGSAEDLGDIFDF